MNYLNAQLNECHMKRDSFLHHVVRTELPYLSAELEGYRTSQKAKQFISNKIRRMELTTVNVVFPKTTADELRDVVEKHNLVRDAFINRLVLFLLSPGEFLERIEVPAVLNHSSMRDLGSLPTSPLGAIKKTLLDPLYFIRNYLEDEDLDPIYRVILAGPVQAFSCYWPDELVPGTTAEKKSKQELDKIIGSLFKDGD